MPKIETKVKIDHRSFNRYVRAIGHAMSLKQEDILPYPLWFDCISLFRKV